MWVRRGFDGVRLGFEGVRIWFNVGFELGSMGFDVGFVNHLLKPIEPFKPISNPLKLNSSLFL